MHVLDGSGVSFQIVLTKTDKLGADELAYIAERVVGDLAPHAAAHPEIHLTSALKRQGITALRATLGSLALSGSTPAILATPIKPR
jgi:GTP-binding protein